jgi:hypothetical protein
MARELECLLLGGSAALDLFGKILESAKAEDHQAYTQHERHQDEVIRTPVLVLLDEIRESQKKIADIEERKLGGQDADDDSGIPDITAAPVDLAQARKEAASQGWVSQPLHLAILSSGKSHFCSCVIVGVPRYREDNLLHRGNTG